MLKETSLYAESWNVAWRQKSRGRENVKRGKQQ